MSEFDGRAERWYENKVTYLIALVGAIITCVLYVSSIATSVAVQQQQLADIKNNDLTHIELEITAINQQMKDQQNLDQQTHDAVTTLSVQVQQLISNKK